MKSFKQPEFIIRHFDYIHNTIFNDKKIWKLTSLGNNSSSSSESRSTENKNNLQYLLHKNLELYNKKIIIIITIIIITIQTP